MNFRTYANEKKNENISTIKTFLLQKIEEAMEVEQNNWKLSQIYFAIYRSGGSNFASRYGLTDEIFFADTELLCAYEKGDGCVEYLIYRFDFKYYPQKREVNDFPLVVAIEASSRCNLRCKMCFQRNMDTLGSGQNSGIMSMEVFETFLNELDKHRLYSIVFASRGEPLLNPNIANMIFAAKQRGVMEVKLNTNATLLSETVSRKLLLSGLDLLVFSVDSIFPETYKDIRGCDLNVVLRNIHKFLEIKKKEFPHSSLKVRVAMVVTADLKDPEREIEAARDYWIDCVDEFSVKTENDFVAVYSSDKATENSSPCGLLWERLYLWYNGEVNPCDIDHLSKLSLGNILKGDTIYSIWHGEKLEGLRREHEALCRKSAPCTSCIGY